MTRTFTAEPRDVQAAFATVLPHVSTDAHLPLVNVVHVEMSAATMTLAATDRFTAAIYRADLEAWTPKPAKPPKLAPLAVDVFARDLRRLFAFGKDSRREPARWTFGVDRVSVEFAGGETSSIRTVDVGNFPDLRKILAANADRPDVPAGVTNLAQAQLEKFVRSADAVGVCAGGQRPLHLWASASPLKPTIVTCGDSFAGMVMPVRVDDELTLQLDPFLAVPRALAAGGVA